MIIYKTNPNNEDYTIIDGKTTIYFMFFGATDKNGRYKNKISSEFIEKINQMQADLFDYEGNYKS